MEALKEILKGLNRENLLKVLVVAERLLRMQETRENKKKG